MTESRRMFFNCSSTSGTSCTSSKAYTSAFVCIGMFIGVTIKVSLQNHTLQCSSLLQFQLQATFAICTHMTTTTPRLDWRGVIRCDDLLTSGVPVDNLYTRLEPTTGKCTSFGVGRLEMLHFLASPIFRCLTFTPMNVRTPTEDSCSLDKSHIASAESDIRGLRIRVQNDPMWFLYSLL